MRTKYLYLSLLVFLSCSMLLAAEHEEYSKAEKSALYQSHKPPERAMKSFLYRTDRDWQELNMPALVRKFDRTQSAAGAVEFERLLQPISDTKELASRRIIIEYLIHNVQVFEQLHGLVNKFALEHETLFAHFLDERARLEFLVDKDAALFGKGSSLYQIGLQGFMTLLLAQNIAYEGRQAFRNWGDVANRANGGFQRGWIGYNLLGQTIGIGWAGYYATTSINSTLKRINEADSYVLKVGKALKLISSIHDVIQSSPELATSEIANAFVLYNSAREANAEFRKAAAGAGDRLGSENSWLRTISKFNSLDTYDRLKDSALELMKGVQALAVLDAYLAVANLHNELRTKGSPVSLAAFTSSNDIGFAFEGLVNPLIDASIPNNFALGGASEARHGVITGPHGCGKTTIMKSAAYAFILGQSILVVPAHKALFAPLTALKTYFNVGDNILEGLSSFMSEHQRVAELIKAAERLRFGERALFLVDEPYAKTIQTIGEPRVTDFLRKLSANPSLSVILATHFEEPSLLEAETKGIVKNFQPELDADLNPTYKIVDGAAKWWFHDVSRRDQFIDKLIH